MRISLSALGALALAVLLLGCAPAPKPEDYTVDVSASVTHRFQESVRIAPVKTLGGSAWLRPSLDPAMFAAGLAETLTKSQLFSAVTTSASAELEMRAEIIYQQPVDPYSISVPLLVHYDLRDASSGRTIWKGNFFSLPEVPDGRSFGDPTGSMRHQRVVREAIRDNFSQLIRSLSEAPIRRQTSSS